MVQFNEKNIVITYEAGGTPIDYWLGLFNGLLALMRTQSEDFLDANVHVVILLEQMLPDYDLANRMLTKVDKPIKPKQL